MGGEASRTTNAGRLAAVLAHPDDESRLIGGTLALAARRGLGVSVYCATRGEAGDAHRSPAETAALRENELRAACQTLDVGELWLDEFPDGALAETGEEAVMARIVQFLRATRPHAVITFGPDGRTGHPDHVAVGRLAEAAFAAAGDATRHPGDPDQRVAPWQPTSLHHIALAESVARRLGSTNPALPDAQLLAVDVSPVLERKRRAAMQCHASQWALSPMALAADGSWEPWASEHFRRARPATAPTGGDLLAELAQAGG